MRSLWSPSSRQGLGVRSPSVVRMQTQAMPKSMQLTLEIVAITVLLTSPFARTFNGLSRPGPVANPPQVKMADLDQPELANFIDQFMASNMARFHAPGATVVVTREGTVVFEK